MLHRLLSYLIFNSYFLFSECYFLIASYSCFKGCGIFLISENINYLKEVKKDSAFCIISELLFFFFSYLLILALFFIVTPLLHLPVILRCLFVFKTKALII